MEAYILISVEPGKVSKVVEEISKIEGVESAHMVTGPFDIIVHAKASDLNSLSNLILQKIQGLEGIRKTMTCLIVK